MSEYRTIGISLETWERFDWYKGAYGMTSDELLNLLMNTAAFDNIEQIRIYKDRLKDTLTRKKE